MFLITSSAYVIQEFQAELGKIPPCMLPIGNVKLFEQQINEIKKIYPNEQIYISLPESYKISQNEQNIINKLSFTEIITVPDTFSLSEAISFVLNLIDYNKDETLKILYGDTLIKDIPNNLPKDYIGTSEVEDNYNWKYVNNDSEDHTIWCGFYSFSQIKLLLKSLALHRMDFIQAIEYYKNNFTTEFFPFSQWFDLGHVNTYFKTRAFITTQRAFNELNIKDGVLKKTGTPSIKIQAEAFWFNNIPTTHKVYTPQLIEHGQYKENYFYSLEFLPNMPLNELFVHGKIGTNEWRSIFKKINTFLNINDVNLSDNIKKEIDISINHLYTTKMYNRLNDYCEAKHIDPNLPNYYNGKNLPSLNEITQSCIDNLKLEPIHYSIMHGDLCLSNILLDSRAGRIKVIDPRGLTNSGEFSIYGDKNYDLAKLSHSIIGLYDYIIAGRASIKNKNTPNVEIVFDIDYRITKIQELFISEFIPHEKQPVIFSLMTLLFISMLPLHADRPERQELMLLNALRLYTKAKSFMHSI